MRRYSLTPIRLLLAIAATVVASLAVATTAAQAIVVNDSGTEPASPLVPGTGPALSVPAVTTQRFLHRPLARAGPPLADLREGLAALLPRRFGDPHERDVCADLGSGSAGTGPPPGTSSSSSSVTWRRQPTRVTRLDRRTPHAAVFRRRRACPEQVHLCRRVHATTATPRPTTVATPAGSAPITRAAPARTIRRTETALSRRRTTSRMGSRTARSAPRQRGVLDRCADQGRAGQDAAADGHLRP